MTTATLKELLARYRAGTITQQEWDILRSALADPDWRELIHEDMSLAFETLSIDAAWNAARERQVLDRVFKRLTSSTEAPVRRMSYLSRWWAAAAIILVLGAGVYLWQTNAKQDDHTIATTPATSIHPGKDGAVLTLADGTQVSLDGVQNGTVATQAGSAVKVVDGKLMYEGKSVEILYNTVATPKGRQYKLSLPDGTNIWLNAASYIRYPTSFTGKERRVEITGEAYFEVKKSSQPFIVKVGSNVEVTVLGTSFNINSYNNEKALNTTLLEGSVRVSKGNESVILKPGEQAKVRAGIEVKKEVDIDKVLAWKNGLFNFEDVALDEVLRQLERWYDIEVQYEKDIPNLALTGKITRGVSLNALLTALKKMGLHYELQGRTLRILASTE